LAVLADYELLEFLLFCSGSDIEIACQVVEAGKALRIAGHDHLIVGREGVASVKALGIF
jgi:DNA repair protein RadC